MQVPLPSTKEASTKPLPLYDLDEIIANLTLEETIPEGRKRKPPRLISSSAPSTPVKPKASSSRPVGPASPSLYRVKTPTQIQYTEDWYA
jgi:hypothetical protein